MTARERQRLDRMFHLRAVAVYGAVHEPGNFLHCYIEPCGRYETHGVSGKAQKKEVCCE